MAAMAFGKRQFVTDPYDDMQSDSDDWWYSDDAYVAKWAILGTIFLLIFIYFVGGHLHAKARMRKGLPLLAYHRWLIPRHRRPGWRPAYATYYIPNQQQWHQQPQQQPPPQPYSDPPPLYDGYGMPPVYAPPNKVPLDPEPAPGFAPSQAGPASQQAGVQTPQPAALR